MTNNSRYLILLGTFLILKIFWFIDRPFKDFELDEVVALPEARSDFLYSIEDIHPDFGSIKGATL